MNWSRRLENSHFLNELYGGLPSLAGAEIESVSFGGGTCSVKLTLAGEPMHLPPKYRGSNAAFAELEVGNLKQVLLTQVAGYGVSDIPMQDVEQEVVLRVTGVVELTLTGEFIRIVRVSPYLRNLNTF